MIDLPGPIAAYFEADRAGSPYDVSQCFSPNATVKDEGSLRIGREEIEKWKSESNSKFAYSCTPIHVEQQHGKFVVTGHLVGNFPGSPIDLRYFFELENDKITYLEIIP